MALPKFLLLLAAVVTALVANFKLRSETAPPVGSGGFIWPWQAHVRYTKAGWIVQVLSYGFWSAFLVLQVRG